MENQFLIDWLTFTTKIHDLLQVTDMLGLDLRDFGKLVGRYGYASRYVFGNISILVNGTFDMGICVEMSGQGCRDFETFGTGNYDAIFQEILDNPGDMKITRIDIAFDDHSGMLDINTIMQDTLNGNFISRWTKYEAIYSNGGNSVIFGSRQSEMMIRIYDKALERGFTDGRHWIRVEIVFKRERAMAFIDGLNLIGDKFCGVLTSYLRFVEPNELDSNKWRWELKDYWADLLQGATPIRLYKKPGTEYNLMACEDYVYKQAGSPAWSLILIRGLPAFLDDLIHRGTKFNSKYKNLLNVHGINDTAFSISPEELIKFQRNLELVRESIGA